MTLQTASNEAVLRALGLTEAAAMATEVVVHLKAGDWPSVLITRFLPEVRQAEQARFTLTLGDGGPAFDLDAMCAAAMARVRAFVDEAALAAQIEMVNAEHAKANERLRKAIDELAALNDKMARWKP